MADEDGKFDWAAPDEEVHRFVNALERPIGTHLYGRRTYDVLCAWETMDTSTEPAVIQYYADIWRSADKVVYSTTLEMAATARTRIERRFEPEAVRQLKDSAERDLSVGGPGVAGQAIAAGLVDDVHLIVSPVVVGGGTRALPDDVRLQLGLIGVHCFGNGAIHLHYRLLRDL